MARPLADEDKKKPDNPIPSDLVSQDASFADLVQEFVDGLDQRMEDMNKALTEGDFQSIKHLAHQLKGSGGGYGYPSLTKLASEIEQHSLAEAIPACQQGLDELKVMISRVVVKLD